MAQRVGEKLGQNHLNLRFTSSNNNATPKAVIKRALNQSVADLTQTGYYPNNNSQNVVLFYERLDVSIIELETKKSLKITWTGQHNREEVSGGVTHLAVQIAELIRHRPAGNIPLPATQNKHVQRCQRCS